jgi:hypothetical protein
VLEQGWPTDGGHRALAVNCKCSTVSCLALGCGHLGLNDEAAEWIARRNRVGPPLRAGVLRENLRDFAHRDVFVEGLRKAGVPE